MSCEKIEENESTTKEKNNKIGKVIIIVVAILACILFEILFYLWCNDNYNGYDFNYYRHISTGQFNEKFLQYEGKRKGRQIKSLLQQVIANNANDDYEDLVVTVEFCDDGEIISRDNPINYKEGWELTDDKIKSTSIYNVEILYSDEGPTKGFVSKIIIKEVRDENT